MKTKPASTITTAIFVSVLAAGLASAQSPSAIQNTRNTMNAVSDKAPAASKEMVGIKQPGVRQTPPAAASATHDPAKTSGTAGVAPAKSSPSAASPTAAKTNVGVKRVSPVTGRHSVQPKPVAAPSSHPPAAASLASNGAAATGDGANQTEQPVVPEGKYAANGRRDPFLSPVVSHAGGSGCSTGKKCLEIGTISLRGVVHADSGFIAVVSNGLNKAYFLRENDPVFNGYVVKITGDSIVFQETLQDRLGKTITREVVKKITAPAV